jgi:multidrug resistance efflux pump
MSSNHQLKEPARLAQSSPASEPLASDHARRDVVRNLVADAHGSLTARDQINHVDAALRTRPVRNDRLKPLPVPPSKDASQKREGTPIGPPTSKILKSALAILAVFALGWLPLNRLLATTSAEAIVNSRVITVRAPIEGTVSLHLDIGALLTSGDEIASIDNPRVDRSSVIALQHAKSGLVTNIALLKQKRQILEARRVELTRQIERFRIGRVDQLTSRIAETDSQLASARLRHKTAAVLLRRTKALSDKGIVSEAVMEKTKQDEGVAREDVNGLLERRKGALVELEAARAGTYVGDSYNDIPQSAQRIQEVSLDLAEVMVRLAGAESELAETERSLASEAKRVSALSADVVRTGVTGRVWEVLTADGEHVSSGQELLRILDCASAVVTATVSEAAYQRLTLGQRAVFRPRSSGNEIKGWIIGLTGQASVSSNMAIQLKVLTKEPYHVTLKFPELAGEGDCGIGRSGLITFDANAWVSNTPSP